MGSEEEIVTRDVVPAVAKVPIFTSSIESFPLKGAVTMDIFSKKCTQAKDDEQKNDYDHPPYKHLSPFSFFAGIRSLLFFTFVHIPLHTGDKFALRAAFSCFCGLHRHTVLPTYYDATDCSAFHAPAILKTFEIRPLGCFLMFLRSP